MCPSILLCCEDLPYKYLVTCITETREVTFQLDEAIRNNPYGHYLSDKYNEW